LVNALGDTSEDASPAVLREAIDATLLLLAPFVPHVASELWEAAGHARSLDAERWPAADPGALARPLIELPVQVNGKLRGPVPESARTIRIALFTNHTRETGLEVRLHRAVEDEFRRQGTLRIVTEDDADLVLSGDIRRFTSVPVAFSATDEAVQYQGIMQVS